MGALLARFLLPALPYLIGAALLGGAWLWWNSHWSHYRRLQVDVVTLKDAAATSAKAAEEQRQRAERLDALIVARDRDAARDEARLAGVLKSLEKVYAADPKARAWRDEPVPDGVAARVRALTGGGAHDDGEDPAAAGAASAGAGAGLQPADERRVGGLPVRVGEGPAGGKPEHEPDPTLGRRATAGG